MPRFKLLALAPLMVSATALAQADAGPEANQAIIVDGRQIQKQANDFVKAITRETSTDQYAQFTAPLCPQVIGYQKAEVELVLSRLNVVAQQTGIEIDKPKCQPNVVIVLAPDANELLAMMKKRGVAQFVRHPYSDKERRRQSEMPVRWWHNISLADSSGRRLSSASASIASSGASDQFTTSGSGGGRAERSGAGLVSSTNSLILKATAPTISTAFVVVNMELVKGYDLSSVADYSAFVALSQISLGVSNVNAETILNLFDSPPVPTDPPMELSQWDLAYLGALKDAPANRAASQQRGSMARSMRKEIEALETINTSPEAPAPQ
jgi:hypothetical protein